MRGRPTIYTPELADRICQRIADGETMVSICADKDMPCRSAVAEWVVDDREGFAEKYWNARRMQAIIWSDEIMEIADDARNDWMEAHGKDSPGYKVNGEHVTRSKLRVESRKFFLAKILGTVFGDKSSVELTGRGGGPVQHEVTTTRDLIDRLNNIADRASAGVRDRAVDVSSNGHSHR